MRRKKEMDYFLNDLMEEYIYLVKLMEEYPTLYTMDTMRTITHDKIVSLIIEIGNLNKSITKERLDEEIRATINYFLHNLNKYNYDSDVVVKEIKKILISKKIFESFYPDEETPHTFKRNIIE
jgi:hypothetical protein